MRPKKRYPNWPVINGKTTVKEVLVIHKRIWNFVMRHGFKPTTPYLSNCAGCQYTFSKDHQVMRDCEECPFELHCDCADSLYDIWFNKCKKPIFYWRMYYTPMSFKNTMEQNKNLAKQIRDVKLKRGYISK